MGARAEKKQFFKIKFFKKSQKLHFWPVFLSTCPPPPPFEKILDPPLHYHYNLSWWPLVWALSLGALNSFLYFSAIRERIYFSAVRERNYFSAIRERTYFSAIRVLGSVTRHRAEVQQFQKSKFCSTVPKIYSS